MLALALLVPFPILAEPVLIAHPSVPVAQLDRNTARLLFSMRRPQWEDGTPVHVYVLDDRDPLHVRFCREVLKLYPRQLRRVWDRQTFSGTGQAPDIIDSVEEMRDKVAEEPGAIGYLPRELVDDRVKILEMQ